MPLKISRGFDEQKEGSCLVCLSAMGRVGSQYYVDDDEAGQSLKADPKVLGKLRSRTPVAKSTLLKMLHRFAKLHDPRIEADSLVVDTRSP
jgi:hypothetical protein